MRVWREVGGWEIEDIWRYWAPVTPEEEAGLRAAFAGGDDEGMARASALILARPHLVEAPTGRVRWSVPVDIITARNHMMIHVALPDGGYLTDVGFGGMTPTDPLKFEARIVQETPHEPFRLLRDGTDWLLQAEVAGTWSDVYRFDLTPQLPIDYEAGNYYLANSDNSFFTQGVIAARHAAGQRMALNNRSFTIYPAGKAPQRRMLKDAAEICDTLEKEFGIRLPDRDALIARIDAKKA